MRKAEEDSAVIKHNVTTAADGKSYDLSLKEVWWWKDQICLEVKNLTPAEYIEKIRNDVDKHMNQHNLKLRVFRTNNRCTSRCGVRRGERRGCISPECAAGPGICAAGPWF